MKRLILALALIVPVMSQAAECVVYDMYGHCTQYRHTAAIVAGTAAVATGIYRHNEREDARDEAEHLQNQRQDAIQERQTQRQAVINSHHHR